MATQPSITPEAYLAYERQAEVRHEYYDGEVFAMSGGSGNHAMLISNCIGELHAALKDRGCIVYSGDLRVHIPASGLFTYPDLSVVCGEPHYLDEQRDTLLNPVLLVEVLSPSTESYDRGQKFAFYRSISSLREYVLVSQHQQLVEVFRKNDEGRWVLYEFKDAAVTLAAAGCTLPLDDLYANVELEGPSLR